MHTLGKIKWEEGTRQCQRNRNSVTFKKVRKGGNVKVTLHRMGVGECKTKGNSTCKGPEAGVCLAWSRKGLLEQSKHGESSTR